MVAKEPIVDGRRPKLTKIALVAAVRFFDFVTAYNRKCSGDLEIRTVFEFCIVPVSMTGV